MRKILITTDFGPESTRNIEHVLELLKHTSRPSSLILLNTYLVPPAGPAHVIELNDELKKTSREGLAREKEKALAKNLNPLVTIETASHMGSLFNVVQNLLGRETYKTISFCEGGPEKLAQLVREDDQPILITCN